MSASLGPIGQIAYTVSDVPRAVAFYRDAVGLTLLFEAPPGLAFFDCDGVLECHDDCARDTDGAERLVCLVE